MSKDYFNHLHVLNSNMNGIKPNVIYHLEWPRGGFLSRNMTYYSVEFMRNFFDSQIQYRQEQMKNEYRKFIEENKYGRVGNGRRTLSVPRVQLT